MRNQIITIFSLLIIGLSVSACSENQNGKTITGIVQEIQTGKDGYTAKIETSSNEIYYATISHSNLKDHSQYRSVQVGETIEVAGDQWDMEGKKQITVRQLYPGK